MTKKRKTQAIEQIMMTMAPEQRISIEEVMKRIFENEGMLKSESDGE